MMKVPLLFLGLMLLALSCNTQETCEEDSISEIVALFKTETEGIVSDTTIDNLRIYGMRADQPTWFLYDSVSESDILLPLDPNQDQSSFVFIANGYSDTLTLSHSSEDYLISFSCGFGKRFTLGSGTSYEGGMIVNDSLIYPDVNTTLEEDEIHIWLYF